jgi:hypothetical protein
MIGSVGRIAVLWRSDRASWREVTPQHNSFHRVFEELAAAGIDAEPAVYDEVFSGEVREQLLQAQGVLVEPIHQQRTRRQLAPLLRDVGAHGPWVSDHSDIILRMDVKEALHRTKHLGWSTDTHLYRTLAEFRFHFSRRLTLQGPRVLKRNRGMAARAYGKWNRLARARTERCRSASFMRSARTTSR